MERAASTVKPAVAAARSLIPACSRMSVLSVRAPAKRNARDALALGRLFRLSPSDREADSRNRLAIKGSGWIEQSDDEDTKSTQREFNRLALRALGQAHCLLSGEVNDLGLRRVLGQMLRSALNQLTLRAGLL